MGDDLKLQEMQATEDESQVERIEIDDLELGDEAGADVAGGCATGKHMPADGTLID